jgi:hypothetical protein
MHTCTCRCHQKEGIKTLHHMPCCPLVHKKYINQDGAIDEPLLNKFREEVDKK